MAQKIPMQDESLPQMDPEPEMGAAAAAAAEYDTSPSLLRNPPPIPAETAHPSALDMVQLSPFTMTQMMEMITQAMRGEMQ